MNDGVSANLCEALVEVIEPFQTVDVSLTWARTRPTHQAQDIIHFAADDAPILREASRLFRDHEPCPDKTLFGVVRTLSRGEAETKGTVTLLASIETKGTVTLLASIDGTIKSVKTVLQQSDYERAILAHKEKAPVVMKGDLERSGQRWRLLNPKIVNVIQGSE